MYYVCMCFSEVNTSLDDAVQQVTDYFKNKYKSDAILLNSDKCLPYQIKRFINLVFLIHQLMRYAMMILVIITFRISNASRLIK